MSSLLAQTLHKIYAQSKADNDARGTLWKQLRTHGLLNPFQDGLSLWSEGAALLLASAAHASPLPYAEQLLASYLSFASGTAFTGDHLSVVPPQASDLALSDDVTGRAHEVPHAAVASHVWLEVSRAPAARYLALVEVRGVEARAGQNLAGEPRDTLTFLAAPVVSRFALAPQSAFGPLQLLGALTRSIQILALAERVLGMSVEHAKTRRQFGASIASFQAVQHPLALLACEIAALHTSVSQANHAVDRLGLLALGQAAEIIASTKIQAGRTAQCAAQTGHAVHAAIGFTLEHDLHRYTQRLLSYRAEFGADVVFASFLGGRVQERGAEQLWPHLVASPGTNADLRAAPS